MKKGKILLLTSFLSTISLCGGLLLQTNLISNETIAASGEKFVKVTSDSNLSDGKYLIVYEAGEVAFDGSLPTLDVVSNSVKVTIDKEDNSISWTDELEKSIFEYSKSANTLKSASGYYIGKTANSNGLDAKLTKLTNDISVYSDGSADIKSSGGAFLRYNSSRDQTRFRYYKSKSYTAQKPVSLYKLNTIENPSIQFDDSNLSTIDEESDGTFVIKKTAILDTDTITWASSNDNVLLVDENTGYYVASKVSENTTVTVTAKATRDGAEIASASFEVTVMPKVAITGITISNGSSATMAIGDTLKLSATVEPSNANQSVTWSSEDEAICSVDEEGNVKALAEGTVLIKATSVSDATKFATISITANWTIKAARAATQSVTVKGVVTSIDTAQNIVTIQDETAAILLFGLNATQVKSISLGKIVKVSGKLTDFNGLAELTSIDTLEVLGDGNIPTPTILEKTSATDLKGLDSAIFVAEGKLKTASKFASSDVKLTLNLTNGNSIFVYTKAAVAEAIASNWNTFVAKAGTIATIKFTLPLGWYNNPQLSMLPDMSKVESADVDAVDAFVTNFMHPEIETTDSGTGKCSSEGWYLSAKEAYGKLSENQKKMFDTLDGYKDMKARFDAWAAVADTGTGLFSISSSSNNNSMIVIVCMSLILIASVAGYTFYRKRRA
ncbi:MAG TPA: hypothetical protein DCR94_01060 [Firmicutes bacterium]|nr:hypothetical protein [Bacillota bacterium]